MTFECKHRVDQIMPRALIAELNFQTVQRKPSELHAMPPNKWHRRAAYFRAFQFLYSYPRLPKSSNRAGTNSSRASSSRRTSFYSKMSLAKWSTKIKRMRLIFENNPDHAECGPSQGIRVLIPSASRRSPKSQLACRSCPQARPRSTPDRLAPDRPALSACNDPRRHARRLRPRLALRRSISP